MKKSDIQINSQYYEFTIISNISGSIFEVKCSCGTIKEIHASQIGRVKSCGCLNRRLASERAKKLNKRYDNNIIKHPLYGSWQQMKDKCLNSKSKNFLGDKISIHKEWVNSFQAFYDWAIKYWFSGAVLHRVDSDKDYSPDNCIFISRGSVSKENLKRKKNFKISESNLEKRRQTCMKKYGTEYPGQNDSVKEKMYNTNILRYGDKIPSKTDLVKNTTILNNRKKYGVDHPQQLESYKLSIRKKYIRCDDKTSNELAKEIGIATSTLNARIRKYGLDKAISMSKYQSSIESVMELFLMEHSISYVKQVKIDKYIADFYLPDSNLIIECDGLYWHSDAINKDSKYHQKKKTLYDSNGYRSLFFREDEIEKKFEIVKSIILNKIGTSSRIFARKTEVKIVSKDIGKVFLNNNHIMGYGKGIMYGLYYDNSIYAIMQLINKKEYIEISRFCTMKETNIVGGFSKLLTHAIKTLCPKKVITFIDRRYGDGNYLPNLGFKKLTEYISFCWIKNERAYHRLKYPGNSGYSHGMNKFWDCGQAKYELEIL